MAQEMTTPLADASVAMHEAFQSLMEAGFSESQALTIVIGMATHTNG